MTDEFGTRYEFGGTNAYMEYGIDFFAQGSETWSCNAWYLKSITRNRPVYRFYLRKRPNTSGEKHKYATDTLILKYAGNFEYRQVAGANVVDRVALSEGQAVFRKGKLKFEYSLKDHLGNVRVVFDEARQILQRTDYYPFGLSINRDGAAGKVQNWVNRYLFNGKEMQIGSGYLDYGARMYMPEVGHWGVVDPMADRSRRFSPYVYEYNNALRFIDPDGRLADDPQKGILQRIFDFFGLFRKPESAREAAAYANVRGSTSISNATYTKTIQALVSLKEGTSVYKLLRVFEAEAEAKGAKKLVIKGIDIIETRLINSEAAKRLGYEFKQTSKNSIELTKILEQL